MFSVVIIRASQVCYNMRAVFRNKTGLVAYLRADQTLQIKDLHCKNVLSKVDFLVYKLGLCLHPADRAHPVL